MQSMSKSREAKVRAIADSFLQNKNNEKCLSTVMQMHCLFGAMHRIIGCSKVRHYKFEFAVKGGRVDLALFHKDGGMSLVEIKAGHSTASVVAGIGQLFFYEAMFLSEEPRFEPPTYIHKYLVVPSGSVSEPEIDQACSLAGVRFVACASFAVIEGHRQDCMKAWFGDGA